MRPLILRSEIRIPAPPDRVWAVLTDIASWPAWCTSVQTVSPPSALGVGARFSF